ncbi:methyltransferase domain-containing protein [Enterobacter bugandensis]|uniref:methyltransferase domain-containing protein n=1 Tax=Enterobacter bugandensis TaxID=881260 RepID=UPI0021CDFCB9
MDSLNNMNQQVALLARLRANARVLDAGCGVGGLSLWLVDKYGADVDSITVCAEQVESARQFAEQDNLNERTAFHQMDYTCTDFPDDAFDAVVAIESVCYAKDKDAFLREASRVLKPGGRLVVADEFRTEGISVTRSDERLIQSWLSGWAVPDLATRKMFCQAATDAGFAEVELQDITAFVQPSVNRLCLLSLLCYPGEWGLWKMQKRTDLQHGNIRAAINLWFALRKKLCFYGLFSATKA